ncbi:hypothetical protein JKF63_06650 [Porcisia hertigi]|uniref:Cyclic nucleotide-binding domain-containing protein n=1 Tax=Porcisia hertigi TaxID=2761500 RepID=A0A836IPC2_9TRYP|nr:hypothetical protein JKF63_06650 [Porcisia hertigi]
MKRGVMEAKSLVALQRLFGPILSLYISRCRAKNEVGREALRYHAPSVDVLKTSDFFSKWPNSALKEWVLCGVLVAYKKGTCIGFAREPPQTACVYWILAGKVTQVPTKSELRECAGELPQLPLNVPKTGPTVLPSHFLEGAEKAPVPILTPTQERIVDSLAIYHTGQLVDAESLLLGGGRRRSLRCQTDTVMVSFPFSLLLRKVQCLPIPLQSYTIDVARNVVQRAMAQLVGLPSVRSLTSANPVLKSLPHSTLRALRLQLKPFVFLQSDVVCHDIAKSDTVFFLSRGRVIIEDTSRCTSKVESKAFTSVGLETFVPYHLPDYCDQKLRAKAATYCEMWGVPTAVLLALCDAETQLRCAQAATQLLGNDTSRLGLASALRTCPCFAAVSEMSLTAIARALRARVYCAGDTILASKRLPTTGILVVAGEVFVQPGRKKPPQRLYAGQAHYFCECFVKMKLAESVVSRSSSIVLHGSPGRIFELMEESNTASDMETMLESAQNYVNIQYGSGASDLSKAQSAAVERVKAYRRRHAENGTTESPEKFSSDTGEALTVLKNELLVSLALQLQALQPDTIAEAHFDVFRAGHLALGGEDPSSDPRPTAEYFSLDREGELVVCASPAPVAPVHFLTEDPVAPSSVVFPLRSDVVAPSLPQQEIAQERAALTRANAPVGSRSLRTEVHASALTAVGRRREPSSRLSALRSTAARLREEAEGTDRQREYQRQLMRVRHLP